MINSPHSLDNSSRHSDRHEIAEAEEEHEEEDLYLIDNKEDSHDHYIR